MPDDRGEGLKLLPPFSSPLLPPLLDAFLARPAAWPDAPDREALATAIDDALAQGRSAWPELRAPSPAAFARALGDRAQAETAAAALVYLRHVHAADLYLVCGCLQGDAAALRALEQQLLARLSRELRAARALAPYVEEASQMLRVRLLVLREGEREVRLAGYRGQGPLLAWLRLTLTRLALDVREHAARDVTLDAELLAASPLDVDPELAYLRRHYREQVSAAVMQALERVAADERTMLRMHFLDGLSAGEVGQLFDMSGRTVQRRIAAARRAIIADTRAILCDQMGVNRSQFDTLLRLVGSELDLSLRRLLAGGATP